MQRPSHSLGRPDAVAAAFQRLPTTGLRAALVGRGIGESRTPRMHMAEGARLGIDYSYSLIDFDELAAGEAAAGGVVDLARRHGLAGLNVTHPFKQSIISQLDELSPEAAAIGAVNTVVLRAGKAVGYNTDSWGFAESFRREMQGASLDGVLLLGAGGAGKAVARALAELGTGRTLIFDVDRTRAASLAGSLGAGAAVVDDVDEAARGAGGLVNATPVGMAKYPGMPLPAAALRPGLWVADIIYFPAETELLGAARRLGSRTMAGRGMAIFQAVKAFELITGIRPDPDAMAGHFEAAFVAAGSLPPD